MNDAPARPASRAALAPAEAASADVVWPRWWRLALLAVGTLILCSCSAPQVYQQPSGADIALGMDAAPAEVCDTPSSPAAPDCVETIPAIPVAGLDLGLADAPPALPLVMAGAWKPDGLPLPWPEDEYLRDGGDRGQLVRVDAEWAVDGLDPEDTVAHYDTVDGQRCVTPSNIVPIYAPRFGSVRLVTNVVLSDQINTPSAIDLPTKIVQQQENQEPTTALQNEEVIAQVGPRTPVIRRGRQWDGGLSRAIGLAEFQDAFLPYENIAIIRRGIFQANEKAYLAEGITAAITWTKDQPVHVIIDGAAATEIAGDQRAQATFATGPEPGCPMLRIVKVASTQFARPGETVDFTLRFDNVGTQVVGNVTILDSLTTRLEYVPDSAQASVAAEFFADPNEGDSLILRWEIRDPLEPGAGGICRFRCRVR